MFAENDENNSYNDGALLIKGSNDTSDNWGTCINQSHSSLPPGWEMCFSRTKKIFYEVHPHHKPTWCFPGTTYKTSSSSFSINQGRRDEEDVASTLLRLRGGGARNDLLWHVSVAEKKNCIKILKRKKAVSLRLVHVPFAQLEKQIISLLKN